MGRPRKTGNKDLPPGLYCDQDGYYRLRHPLTGHRAHLGTRDRARAVDLYWQARTTWDDALLQAQATIIAKRLTAVLKPPGKRTFAEYSTYYRTKKLPKAVSRSGRPLADHTREDYRRILENAIERSEHFVISLEAVDDVVCRKFLARWLDNPAHYNYVKSVLSRVFRCAIDEGLLRANQVEDISRRATSKRNVYIPDDHYVAITGRMAEWESRVCDLIYFNSHRPGDVLGLCEENISLADRDGCKVLLVTFTAAKNDQPMEISDLLDGPLASTIQWFRDWKRDQGIVSQDLVVYPRTSRRRSIGRRVSVEYISRRFAEAIVAAGFPKGAYQLRDLRKKGLTDEARLAGRPTDKGGHKTEQMKRLYVVGQLPMRVKNNLRALRE